MTDLSEEYPDARVSRTARYRKVTKPLLERRRRARINRCLEELKDLMVGALEVERENINKLEKADILELTVRHLSKLKGPRDLKVDAERFQAGFGHCAAEAYHFILSTPGVDQNIIQQLVKHLSTQLNEKPMAPVQPPIASPAPSMSSVSSGHSAPSPNFSVDYQRTSPSISPRDDRAVSQGWKEDHPSIPVERTLTCDVSSYNAHPHPAVRRSGEPGLLMTVNDARKMPSYVPENVHLMHNSREVYERRVNSNCEFKDRPAVDPNAERKNVILKKIREHIMERQHREPDSTTSSKKDTNQNQKDIKSNRTSQENTLQSSDSIDPSNLQRVRNSNPYIENQYADKRLKQNTREEAVNLTNDQKKSEKDFNCETTVDETKMVTSSQDNNNVAGIKRQRTDYKSIHPKKLIIRTPNASNNNVDKRLHEYKEGFVNQIRNENPIHRVDAKDNNYNVNNRHAPEEALHAAMGPSNEKHDLVREGFQRYKNHYFNLEKEEYYRNPNLDQDDMWRPW